MNQLIGSTSPFSEENRNTLRKIAALLIPKSEEFEVPGADDDAVFTHFIKLASGQSNSINKYLEDLNQICRNDHGDSFLKLQNDEQISLLNNSESLLELLLSYVSLAYYQDPRILSTLSLKSSPPFPGGYNVEQGDWSLLDPVKKRDPFYRKV